MPDTFRLETIAELHPVGARVFVPFVIARLGSLVHPTDALVSVRLLDIDGHGDGTRALHLSWSEDNATMMSLPMPDRVVTEFAACGIACVVLPVYANLDVRQVTADGDRFDYWVGDEDREYGLEVSGTTMGDIVDRHRMKVRQLLSNPYGIDGYVVVAGFGRPEVIFSFHKFEGQPHEHSQHAGDQP